MPSYETKLKLGRKLEGVDSETASANQVSVLFRYAPDGADKHVSLSVESDSMTAADVAAVIKLLDERGVLRRFDCKTWVNQPQASAQKFGSTTTWQGTDIETLAIALDRNEATEDGAPAAREYDAAAANRSALLRIADLERKLAEVKAALQGAPETAPTG